MAPQEFTTETFEEALKQDKPVVVDFWAVWSVACLMYKEKLKEVCYAVEKEAICGSVDIDLQPELTERFSVITIPTTLVIYKNEIVKQYMGIQEPEIIIDAVKTITEKR